jgi:hypothetical protein
MMMFRIATCRQWAFFLIVGSALVLCSCDRTLEWVGAVSSGNNLSEELSRLGRANRVVVMHDEKTITEVSDKSSIRAIAALFQRHPQHWVAISGVFADYDFVFVNNDTELASVGISKDVPGGDESRSRISYGDYYQPISAAEVASLANRLALKWPNHR